MSNLMTEDEVRDEAKILLGFNKKKKDVKQGTGQITTFNSLGFRGVFDKPDGWYLPNDFGKPAIILETKSEAENLNKKKWENELLKNIDIVGSKYSKTIGILYNHKDVKVYYNKIEDSFTACQLQNKEYYLKHFTEAKIDQQHIYLVTQRINNTLHFKFGMEDLQERMIFTACALVAQKFNPKNGLQKLKGMDYDHFNNWIYTEISKAIEDDKNKNAKLSILLEEYFRIRVANKNDNDAIDSFIDDVCEIGDLINSDNWNGEDVMAIFFNEFNRYKGKRDAGQVFTPDHVTSFMYRLININKNDKVLDATCGSGAFLVKSMCNMIKEAGGYSTKNAKKIMKGQLFGIELYPKIYALACANMMIHKDGKTNLAQMDAKSDDAANWIKQKKITKVLMNPPYEKKYKPIDILLNVMKSVPKHTMCAFILPDKKLEKDNGKRLLENNTLKTIIKMPENLFFGIGVTTSIYIFETGDPQGEKNIIGYYVEDDGLITVKNQGRQDVKNKWQTIEDYWIKAIHDGKDTKYKTRQIIRPNEHLSYQMPEKKVKIYEEDINKTVFDYLLYEKKVDVKELKDNVIDSVFYSEDK